MCLGTIQKLITHRAVDQKGARYITDTLWMLMESGTEHVKVLQSVTLLLTTDCVVRGETLARVIIMFYEGCNKLLLMLTNYCHVYAL